MLPTAKSKQPSVSFALWFDHYKKLYKDTWNAVPVLGPIWAFALAIAQFTLIGFAFTAAAAWWGARKQLWNANLARGSKPSSHGSEDTVGGEPERRSSRASPHSIPVVNTSATVLVPTGQGEAPQSLLPEVAPPRRPAIDPKAGTMEQLSLNLDNDRVYAPIMLDMMCRGPSRQERKAALDAVRVQYPSTFMFRDESTAKRRAQSLFAVLTYSALEGKVFENMPAGDMKVYVGLHAEALQNFPYINTPMREMESDPEGYMAHCLVVLKNFISYYAYRDITDVDGRMMDADGQNLQFVLKKMGKVRQQNQFRSSQLDDCLNAMTFLLMANGRSAQDLESIPSILDGLAVCTPMNSLLALSLPGRIRELRASLTEELKKGDSADRTRLFQWAGDSGECKESIVATRCPQITPRYYQDAVVVDRETAGMTSALEVDANLLITRRYPRR